MEYNIIRFLHHWQREHLADLINHRHLWRYYARNMTIVLAAKRVVGRVSSLVPRGAAYSATVEIARPVNEQARQTFFSKEQSKSVYEYGVHRSNAEELIAQQPVIEVDGPVALCDGGEVSVMTRNLHDGNMWSISCIVLCSGY